MPQFNNKPRFDRKPFGNKPFGGPRGGGFDRGPREMFQANCAKCGNTCEVPFRPNGTKPVYCNNCFNKDSAPRAEFSPRPPRQEFTPRPDQSFNDLKAELRVVNQNLERLISLMTPKAPVAAVSADASAPKAKKASKKK